MNDIKNNSCLISPFIRCESCWLCDFSRIDRNVPNAESVVSKEIRRYNKKENLIQVGDPFVGVYCVQEGNVKIFKNWKKNKEFILWIAGKGDIIGLNSMINGDTYSFSASAIDNVVACFIPASNLKTLFHKEPLVFVQLMRKLCHKLNFLEYRITSISKKSIRAQCAEVLLSIALQDDKESHINYSVNDLAGLIGTTKNYLYKILLEFSAKKILTLRNRKLVVNNISELELIAFESGKQTQ